ncbi:hypothetical protein L9F63_024990, partial [Diploptera punctata]
MRKAIEDNISFYNKFKKTLLKLACLTPIPFKPETTLFSRNAVIGNIWTFSVMCLSTYAFIFTFFRPRSWIHYLYLQLSVHQTSDDVPTMSNNIMPTDLRITVLKNNLETSSSDIFPKVLIADCYMQDQVKEILNLRLRYLQVYNANCVDLMHISYYAYEFATQNFNTEYKYFYFHRIILIIFWITNIVLIIFSVMYSSEQAVQEIKRIRDLIQVKLMNYPLPLEISDQLRLFASHQLLYNNIELCAVGFSLNTSCLCKVLVTICSYVITLVQFG